MKRTFSNIWNKITFWLTDGTNKGVSTGKSVLIGLIFTVPVLLLMLTPWLVWLNVPNHYDEKYYWLQTMSWAVPVAMFGMLFLIFIGYAIWYNVWSNKK